MVYLFILILLFFCVYVYDIRGKTKARNTSYMLIFISFVLLSTLRFRVGGDALFYEDFFPHMPDLSNVIYYLQHNNYINYQPFWIILVATSKSIVNEVIFFQLIHSLIFNVILLIFVRRYSLKPFTVLAVLFISLLYFYYSFEIQRESIAVGFFLLNIKNLENKKWLPYYFWAVISFMFHISAVILFLLPLFNYIKFNRTLLFISLLVSVLVYVFRSAILDLILSLLFLDVMKDKMEAYAEVKFSLLGFWSFYFVRVFLLMPIMLFNIKEKLHENRFRWFYPTFFISSILAQFFVGFDRLLNYLIPVYLILVVDFFYAYYPKIDSYVKKSIIAVSVILHVFFILDYKLFITNDYGQHYYSLFFPYTSVFDPVVIPEREDFFNNLFH